MPPNKYEIFDAHFGEVRSDEELFKEVPDATDDDPDPESEESQKENVDLFKQLYDIDPDEIFNDNEDDKE